MNAFRAAPALCEKIAAASDDLVRRALATLVDAFRTGSPECLDGRTIDLALTAAAALSAPRRQRLEHELRALAFAMPAAPLRSRTLSAIPHVRVGARILHALAVGNAEDSGGNAEDPGAELVAVGAAV